MSGTRKRGMLQKDLGKYNKVGIDSNVFIYYFEGHPLLGPLTLPLFATLEEGKIKATTSTVTLTEVLGFRDLTLNVDWLADKLLSTPNLTMLEVSNGIALEAAKIRREYKFRTPDAIQLATALIYKAQAFVTNDEGFKRFKEIEIVLLTEVKQTKG